MRPNRFHSWFGLILCAWLLGSSGLVLVLKSEEKKPAPSSNAPAHGSSGTEKEGVSKTTETGEAHEEHAKKKGATKGKKKGQEGTSPAQGPKK